MVANASFWIYFPFQHANDLSDHILSIANIVGQSEMTSPGLLVLKSSSKSGLAIAWITGHATIPQSKFIGILKLHRANLKIVPGWGIVACPVIQAIGRPDFEDVLRTRSPGEVVSG